jgi:hypothetical protein
LSETPLPQGRFVFWSAGAIMDPYIVRTESPKPAWILAPRPGLEPATCGLTARLKFSSNSMSSRNKSRSSWEIFLREFASFCLYRRVSASFCQNRSPSRLHPLNGTTFDWLPLSNPITASALRRQSVLPTRAYAPDCVDRQSCLCADATTNVVWAKRPCWDPPARCCRKRVALPASEEGE